jgi:ACS family hexuronate transporter-like MFS transporter
MNPLRPNPHSVISQWRRLVRENQRWVVVALFFLVASVNYLDRQTLSVLAPTLREKLNFGEVEYSYVVCAFLVAYTLGYGFCAQILDRLGVKLGLAVAMAFWSLAGMLHAAIGGWMGLAGVRFLLGLGESFSSPAGVKALAEWIPPRERGLAMGIFSNGNVLGAMLAPPLVAFVTLYIGWRFAFVVTGLLGLLLLLIWSRLYYNCDKHPRLQAKERGYIVASRSLSAHGGARRLTMWELFCQPVCLVFFVVRLLTDPLPYFFSFWLPDYLTHSRGFTLALLGLIGWLPALASDAGYISGGALSDWLVRRGWTPGKSRRILMLAAAGLMLLANVAVRTEVCWLAVALIALLFAAQSCWMVNQLTLISESVSVENVASLLALSALGGGLGGIVSTLLAGRIIAAHGYVPIFTGLSLVHLIAFGVLLAFGARSNRAN